MRQLGMIAVVVLCACATSFGALTVTGGVGNTVPWTMTYGAPTDLGTVIDQPGLATVSETAISGVSKTAFQALNPQVIPFDGGPAWDGGISAKAIGTVVAYYSATGTVTLSFPAKGNYGPSFDTTAGYNYGGAGSAGRQAFSGSNNCDHISTVPSKRDDGLAFNSFDAKIVTTGNKGVGAIGFCMSTRTSGGVTQANPVVFTLSDGTTDTSVSLPEINMNSNHYFFIGYQAPAGKTITRVEVLDDDNMDEDNANMTCGIDDLSFVMVDTAQPLIGDINKDGYVNVGDLQALVAAWGSQQTPPSANWNADADINADGYVNVGDLQLLVAHWGESQL